MMPYNKTDKSFHQTVNELLNLNGEVFVEHYIQRSAGDFYFIRTLDELEHLLKRIGPYDFVTVYKKKQLPCRGILNVAFKEKILREYKTEYDYAFYDYVFYPKKLESYGTGENKDEINQNLIELLNDFGDDNIQLSFGSDPRPLYSKFDLNEDNEMIVISGE